MDCSDFKEFYPSPDSLLCKPDLKPAQKISLRAEQMASISARITPCYVMQGHLYFRAANKV